MKKLIAGIILSCLIIVGCTFFIFYDKPTKTSTMQTTVTTVALEDMTEESRTKSVETTETSRVEEDKAVKDEVQKLETKGNHKFVKTVILDVPSENRLEDEPLENGGAVTAASMLLQYYLIPTNKNELASKIRIEPYKTGDLDRGFVRNIKNGKAVGTNVGPIAEVVKQVCGENFEVIFDKNMSFDKLAVQVQKDKPVWIAISEKNSDFTKKNNKGNYYLDAIVIVGMDQENMYINTSDGKKEAVIKTSDLKKLYENAGKQALYLQRKGTF